MILYNINWEILQVSQIQQIHW